MREMKDSGIEWIGEIPKDWEIIKTKYVADISIGLVTTMTANYVDNLDDGVYLIRNGDIRLNKISKEKMVYISRKFVEQNASRQLLENDIVTVHTGYIGTSAIIREDFIGSVGFATIQSRPNLNIINERYLCWFYNSPFFIKQCMLHNTGDGRQNLNLYDFVDFYVYQPPLAEQQKIADFLDSKCSEIDATAEDIQKEIALLEDYKKSVITEAVTKGLNPDAEMKDSGIEGIKEIPVISKVVRLKYLVDKKITDGTHKTPEYATVDDGSPFLSSKDVRNGYIDWSNVKYITKTLHNILHKEVCCKRGDILLAKNGTTGVAALVDTDDVFDIYVTLAVIRSDKKKVLPEYLLYSINSNVTKEQFSERLVGIGVPNLHLNVIENTNIIVYEISEQQKIVKYLNEKCSCIDDAILIKKKQLEMLADYKKSLIYEYVTGKKEVPHE